MALSRRTVLVTSLVAPVALWVAAAAADQVVKVGIDASLTGSISQSNQRIKNGALMAFEEANAAHAIPGVTIEVLTLDDSTSTAGGPDPAQAATNARKLALDRQVVAAIGPQISGLAKAMAPILSQGGLATITPTATNPDLTDPKFAAQFRPGGKPIFFRTCTTDAYQGPNFANYLADTLQMKSVYVLDDGGAAGIGMADAFQAQSEKKGIKVLGRDRLDEKAADYTVVLTKIKQLNPDALYFSGLPLAGVKLAKQAYEVIPSAIKGGGDSISGPDTLKGAGFPALDGWYTTLPAPNLLDLTKAQSFIGRFQARFGIAPVNASIVAYDAALVIIDAMQRLIATGTQVTREAMRDAIQSANVETLQGIVSFDENGDINDHTISLYQFKKDPNHSLDEWTYQRRYIGVVPAT